MLLAEFADCLGGIEPFRLDALDQQVDPLIRLRQMQPSTAVLLQKLCEQAAQRRDDGKQFWRQDPAFVDIDQCMAGIFAESDLHLAVLHLSLQRGAASAFRGREFGGTDIGDQIVRSERTGDAIDDELSIALVVEMLELAPATSREVVAWRRLVMRARDHL